MSRRAISRRGVLGAALAGLAAVRPARAVPREADVAVIGAGAAGIAAARELIARGKTVAVLEAANRIGGRAVTESESLGLPFDRGAAWLQGPRDHPLTRLARERGIGIVDQSAASEAVFVGDRRATHAERRAYWNAYEEIEDAIEAAGDVPASSVVPNGLDWAGTVQTWIGPMDHGVDFADLSCSDWNAFAELETDYLVEGGLGGLVALAGEGLPVRLSTPATHIDWSGDGVLVDTPSGRLSAKAAIVTVSTGVLAAGSLRFAPELPVRSREAIDALPMGLLVKIGLRTDGERFGLSDNSWVTRKTAVEMPADACFFHALPYGLPMLTGFVGGAYGWEVSRSGEAAAIEVATEALVSLFGSRARRHIIAGTMSDWAHNPATFGAYASARPGQFGARAALAQPVGGRIFFAGEAVAGTHIQLVSGAWMSGAATAAAVAASLDRHCATCGPKRGRGRGASQ